MSEILELIGVSKAYAIDGGQRPAVREISFALHSGEVLAVLGPSGCGKSTLVHLAAGFVSPTSGSIRWRGQEVVGPNADRAVVFQEHNLFPWRTVLGNVSFGPRRMGVPRQQAQEMARRLIASVQLEEFENSWPFELSVGMKQRIGLARAMANRPSVLLMDEAFSSLDAQTAIQMRLLLLSLKEEFRASVLFITHDIDEALMLADRVIVLTPRPASIKEIIQVDLGRPRLEGIRGCQRFLNLRERLGGLLGIL